jgi:hypothetical protein
LKAGFAETAEKLARTVLEHWLCFPAAEEKGEFTEWAGKIARVPKALACAVTAKSAAAGKREQNYDTAVKLLQLLPHGHQKRYSHIFEFCEIPIDL